MDILKGELLNMCLDVEITKIKNLNEYKDDILNITSGNKNMSVFQSYDWLNIAFNECKNNILKRFLYDLEIAFLKRNNELQAIAILEVNKKKKYIKILGDDVSSDYIDILYKQGCTKADIEFFFKKILQITKMDKFYFINLPVDSLSHEVLKNNNFFTQFREEKCVHIDLKYNDYDEYFKHLSKKTRQNIRTGFNKLKKEGFAYNTKIFKGTIDSTIAMECQKIYETRRKKLNSNRKNLGYRVYNLRRKISLFFYNHMVEAMKTNNNAIVVIFYINNEIAAFCHGQFGNKMDISFMQVSINEKYRRFSPGMLMLNELIKNMFENKDFENYNIIDLTRGQEDYKYRLGGIEHVVISGVLNNE